MCLEVPAQHEKWLTYQYIGTYQFRVLNTFALRVRFSTLTGLYLEMVEKRVEKIKKADFNSLIPRDLYLEVGPFIFHWIKSLSEHTSVSACSTVHIWQMAFIYFEGGNMTNAQNASITP